MVLISEMLDGELSNTRETAPLGGVSLALRGAAFGVKKKIVLVFYSFGDMRLTLIGLLRKCWIFLLLGLISCLLDSIDRLARYDNGLSLFMLNAMVFLEIFYDDY